MSRAIEWTPEMENTLQEMRMQGYTCSEIAEALSISKNAVINKCDRVKLPTGKNFRKQAKEPVVEETRPQGPLPAGHPISWGAISDKEWTGPK